MDERDIVAEPEPAAREANPAERCRYARIVPTRHRGRESSDDGSSGARFKFVVAMAPTIRQIIRHT